MYVYIVLYIYISLHMHVYYDLLGSPIISDPLARTSNLGLSLFAMHQVPSDNASATELRQSLLQLQEKQDTQRL